jgi:hypothetical protein
MAIAVYMGVRRIMKAEKPLGMSENTANGLRARVSFRSVFPVDGARLGIAQFNRPLIDAECLKLRRAWERSKLPRVEDFEVTSKQVSFVTPPVDVDATFDSIDTLLANAS